MTATSAVPVHPSNADQLQAWDGDEGAYWAEHAEYFDRSVAAYHERLLATARDRRTRIGSSTSAAAPVRPPATPPAPRPAARRSVSTCPRGCSTTPAARRPRRA